MFVIFCQVANAADHDKTDISRNERTSFSFDSARMIPLRNHTYRSRDFCVSLSGSAIRGDEPYEIFFDTGSWTTSIPYGCLDKERVKILEKDVKDSWGILSDKVQGQLVLTSHDGKTKYIANDYVFFARKKANGDDADCDRNSKWGNSILGGFPGISPREKLPSLPYAIAQKYSEKNRVGFGIVSDSRPGIEENWASFNSYLQIGAAPKITDKLNWRTDIPLFPGREGFSPEAVPGFKVTFSFPNTNGREVPDIVVPGLWATVDTGAPLLTMRLGKENPHRNNTYRLYFTDEGPRWRKGQYKADSMCLEKGVNVRVEFTGSTGKTSHYEFKTNKNFGSALPTQVIVGDWDGRVPWPFNSARTPHTRINLGNTIYFYCPVYFWDISNKRVGLYPFRPGNEIEPRGLSLP